MVKMVMSMLSGMIVVLFSLNLAVAAPSNVQESSRHLYDRVMEEFKHRDYEAALAGFRFFLELHGQSSLAANAQYWVRRMPVPIRALQGSLEVFLPRCVLLPAESEACSLDLEDRANLYQAEGSRESSHDV